MLRSGYISHTGAGRIFIFILLSLGLVSCGSNKAPQISSTTHSVSQPAGDELANSFALGAGDSNFRGIRVLHAYDHRDSNFPNGITGEGVVLGVIDSGFYWSDAAGNPVTHVELENQLLTPATDPDTRSDGDQYAELPTAADAGHGVGVAGAIAAERGNGGIQGIAPGAKLKVRTLGTISGEPGEIYNPVNLDTLVDTALAADLDSLISESDVLAINNSWGFNGNVFEVGAAAVVAAAPDLTDQNMIAAMIPQTIRDALPTFISTAAQASTNAADRKILVWSAGNAHGSSTDTDGDGQADASYNATDPELLPGLATVIQELQGHSIAVASVGRTGEISSFASRCGTAEDYCIVAPGEYSGIEWAASPLEYDENNRQDYINDHAGSSFSAPLVTGTLALMKQALPTMGNHELVTRLFATAFDGTHNGVDYSETDADGYRIYGQGLLDVAAALSMPVGPITVRLGSSISDSTAFSSADSRLSLAGPLAALRSSAASHQVEVYDSIGTPFKVPLQSWLPGSKGEDALERLLAARMLDSRLIQWGESSYVAAYSGMRTDGSSLHGNRLWFNTGGKSLWFASGAGARRDFADPMFGRVQGFSSPFTSLSEGGFALGVQGQALASTVWQLESYIPGTHHSSTDSINSVGLVASLAEFNSDLPWRLSAGMLRESDTVLASEGTGAFSGVSAVTWYSGLELARHYGAWSAYMAAHIGVTDGAAGSGVWRGVEAVRSSSWAAGVIRKGIFSYDDAVGLRVVQSLRAEGGNVNLQLPQRRDVYGNLYSNNVALSAEPEGREIDVALGWQSAFTGNSNLSMDIGLTMDADHVADNSSRLWSGLAWIYGF